MSTKSEERWQKLRESMVMIALAGHLAQAIAKRELVLGTCFHEAGHAVIACLFEMFPREIERTDGGGGRVYLMEPTTEERKGEGESDDERIARMVRTNAAEGAPMDLDSLRFKTEALLYRHWDAVESIAKALYVKHRLGESDIRLVLTITEPTLLEFWPEPASETGGS